MYYPPLVAVTNSIYDLIDNFASVNFFQFAVFAHPFVHFSTRGYFHNHYHGLAFKEGVVELNDVLVSEHLEVLRLFVNVANLLSVRKLFCHINVLNGHFLFAYFLSSQNDFAEAAFS